MRRGLIGFILVAFSTLSMPFAIRAEPLRQQPQVQITSPEVSTEVRGRVSIIGSASIPSFQFYKVEFGFGPNPAQWSVIGDLHRSPVVNAQLEVWDTTLLPDGVYTLRLQAVKLDGNWEEFYVRQVAIANTRPTATATSEATPTRQSTIAPTRTVGPSPTPNASATLHIIAPTAGLSQPTPTPTLSRPNQRQQLPIEPKSWGQAFCFGGIAMGAAFVVLGIVFGLRRLF